jgi:hypothetical protein
MPGVKIRVSFIMRLTAAAALAPHVTAMAQSGGSPILAAVDTGTRVTDVSDGPSPAATRERVRVPFGGTYRLTLALGADTADFVLRIGEQGTARSIAAPAPRKHRNAEPVPVRALIVPASLSADSSTVPAAELTGSITASAADTTTSGHGRWWVTILAGADTDAATPAGRLSRLLLRVQAERERLAGRCEANAKGENRAAKKRDEPPPCDEASGLPVATSSTPGDGILFISSDGHARVEQRTETESGELTLWGSRIDR